MSIRIDLIFGPKARAIRAQLVDGAPAEVAANRPHRAIGEYRPLCFHRRAHRTEYVRAPDRNIYFAITLFAITTVGMTFAVWRLFVLRSEVILADQPEDTAALSVAYGYIMTYSLCETVALFGFVLSFMGFTLSEVAPFYVVGFALMLLFGPRRPRIT